MQGNVGCRVRLPVATESEGESRVLFHQILVVVMSMDWLLLPRRAQIPVALLAVMLVNMSVVWEPSPLV